MKLLHQTDAQTIALFAGMQPAQAAFDKHVNN
jgi:hypothetical protein